MVEAFQHIGSVHEVLIDIGGVSYLFLKEISTLIPKMAAWEHTHHVDPALEEKRLLLQLTHNSCLQILVTIRLLSCGAQRTAHSPPPDQGALHLVPLEAVTVDPCP